jgi:hypothetical protein
MGMFKGLLPKYFSSEWSFAQWKCDSPEAVVAFSPLGQNCVYVLSTACSFSKLSFDPASGQSACCLHEMRAAPACSASALSRRSLADALLTRAPVGSIAVMSSLRIAVDRGD